MIESLRAGLEHGRQWLRPVIEAGFGTVAWLRGEFDAAGSHLEAATGGLAAADQHQIDAVWSSSNDPVAGARIHLAFIRVVRGDLAGAEAELVRAVRRTEQLGFLQGPFSLAFVCILEIGVRIEAGQLDRAAVLAAELSKLAERHGFDILRLYGANWQASVSALASLGADNLDATTPAAHITTLTTFLDSWGTAELNLYITFFDAVLARLLIAAGQPE